MSDQNQKPADHSHGHPGAHQITPGQATDLHQEQVLKQQIVADEAKLNADLDAHNNLTAVTDGVKLQQDEAREQAIEAELGNAPTPEN